MNLTLDIGNTQIFGGVFKDNRLLFTFRKSSTVSFSSDEFGIFIKNIFSEKKVKPSIKCSAIASVVPSLTSTIEDAVKKYTSSEKIFILGPGTKTGINIKYKNPSEVGADRIANCIGACRLYGKNKNYIIIDIGTATTFDLLNSKNEYLGGVIAPGPWLQAKSLATSTAKLSQIEISRPSNISIDSTISAIENGIYYLNLFGMKGLIDMFKKEFFKSSEVTVIGTGGGMKIFENEGLCDIINFDLILYGLNHIIEINAGGKI